MSKKGVLSAIKFIFSSILCLGLVFTAVVFTILNMYKPAVKAYLDGEFIGYFSSEDQFDEVYTDLVTEKQKTDPNVKVYLSNEPKFEKSYIRESLFAKQNVYTNLRAKINTEYTIYNVAVNGEKKMTFNTQDDANKYASSLKKEVSKLKVEVSNQKVSELGEITSIDRADNILKEIVARNKPVEIPKANVNKNNNNNVSNNKVVANNRYANKNVATIGATSARATGSGVWPTVNRRINCAYMGYSGHTGIDLGGAVGTAIYAYRSGVVTFAGWGRGYGLYLKIDHGNGMSTLYGHTSQILVSAGQRVKEGQMIAKIGMTGWTTGPHLHFEVRLNGVPVNPYAYIAGK